MSRFMSANHAAVLRDTQYEQRVFAACMALFDTNDAIKHALRFLRNAASPQELIVVVKMYVISWSSLSDVLAALINEVYQLGYASQDIELSAVLRNRRVIHTELPPLIRGYAGPLRVSHFSRLRNDIVHRGILRDPRIDELWKQHMTAFADNVLGGDGEILFDNAVRVAREATCDATARLAAELHEELVRHHSLSCELVAATSNLLAKVVRRAPRPRLRTVENRGSHSTVA